MSKRKNNTGIPDFTIDSIARAMLPAIVDFFRDEKNLKDFEQWKKDKQILQLNKKQNKESH